MIDNKALYSLGYGLYLITVREDGKDNGCIDYASNATNDALRLEFGEWQTFTVNIEGLGEVCTEFALVIPAGNVVYIKDLSFS